MDAPSLDPAGFDAPIAPEPAWPKVVGIISTCWASLGLFCGVCGTTMGFVGPMMAKMAEQQMGGPMPKEMQASPAQLILGVVGLGGSALLLAAGIATTKRRPAGRSLHLFASIAGLILTAIGGWLAYQQQMALSHWLQQNPSDPWARQANPGIGLAIGGFMTLLGLAWPIFCLVWFGAMGKRPEVGAHERTLI
jgi:hypothetical protein